MVNGLQELRINRINGHTRPAPLVSESLERQEVDLVAIEGAVRTILRAVGEDPDRAGLLDTPRHVARMYKEMFSGLHRDPVRHLKVTFPEEYDHAMLINIHDGLYEALCDYRERTGDSLKLKRFEAPTSVENLAHQLFSEISAMGFNLDRLEVQETDTSTVIDQTYLFVPITIQAS